MTSPELQSFLEKPVDGGLRARLEDRLQRFEELERQLADPEATKDRQRFQEILREHGASIALMELYRSYRKVEDELDEALRLSRDESEDAEMRELALAELDELEQRRGEAARHLREYLLDTETEGSGNAIVEIRAGTGGDEAALFAADVFRMYQQYAERRRWKIEVLDSHPTDLGGFREITFSVNGRDAYQRLQFESGGHRVQRIPETETQGRIHTSAVTVGVFQEAEESEIEIHDKDLRIDTFCASGPGGQKVNKTSSAVRITHIPTGVVVSIQDEKSQHKNKSKALRVLRSRLKELQDRERREKEDTLRRTLIGSGDRSDRIRTYNFPQNRVTDHRINLSIYSLDRVMLGELDDLLEPLQAHDREERVQQL